jgi:phosphoribosylglycinamide formyltransferase-1
VTLRGSANSASLFFSWVSSVWLLFDAVYIFPFLHPNGSKFMSREKFRIAVFASGSGTNAEVVFKYFKDHQRIEVALLLSNNSSAYALRRAENHGIETLVFNRQEFREGKVIEDKLMQAEITHIVLAGFLWLIPSYLLRRYPDRIVNIHPALLPKYGGKGMYGAKVHEAVKASRELETGITIHLVNERYDEGKVLFQGRCAIGEQDTPVQIAACVQKLEHEHYPKVIEKWVLSSTAS